MVGEVGTSQTTFKSSCSFLSTPGVLIRTSGAWAHKPSACFIFGIEAPSSRPHWDAHGLLNVPILSPTLPLWSFQLEQVITSFFRLLRWKTLASSFTHTFPSHSTANPSANAVVSSLHSSQGEPFTGVLKPCPTAALLHWLPTSFRVMYHDLNLWTNA